MLPDVRFLNIFIMCGFSLLRTLYKTLCITHLITCLLWRILFKKRQKVATNKSASTFLTSHNKEHQKRPTATLNSFIIPCTHQTEILRFTHSCLFPHTSTWTWTPYQNQQTPFWWEDVPRSVLKSESENWWIESQRRRETIKNYYEK